MRAVHEQREGVRQGVNVVPSEIPTGWTIDTYAAHNEALRGAQDRLDSERDRRYTEVASEREKALRIKESADETARILVAENQAYKDEKANELRSQIERERGTYATKDDLAAAQAKAELQLKPVADFVLSQQGRSAGIGMSAGVLVTALGIAATLITVVILYTNRHSTPTPSVTVTVPAK